MTLCHIVYEKYRHNYNTNKKYKYFMKNILIMLCCFYITFFNTHAQKVHFQTGMKADGVISRQIVGFFEWNDFTDTVIPITFDLDRHLITSGNKRYTIEDKSNQWTVKRELKYVTFSCYDDFYNKICIRMCQYDKGYFIIYILGENKGEKYISEYIDNKSIYNNKKNRKRK